MSGDDEPRMLFDATSVLGAVSVCIQELEKHFIDKLADEAQEATFSRAEAEVLINQFDRMEELISVALKNEEIKTLQLIKLGIDPGNLR